MKIRILILFTFLCMHCSCTPEPIEEVFDCDTISNTDGCPFPTSTTGEDGSGELEDDET